MSPHEWEVIEQPRPFGRDDGATHECYRCGMLVELDDDGNPAYEGVSEERSGILGAY